MEYSELLKGGDTLKLKKFLQTNSVEKRINGHSLLTLAVAANNIKFVRLLLENGAKVNDANDVAETPLQIACRLGLSNIASILIEYGAQIDSTSLDFAYSNNKNRLELLKLMKGGNWINLYLDDLRDCPEGFVIARTVEEAKRLLKSYNVHMLSLDHDLGEDKDGELLPTGYDFVKYICENQIRPANKIYLHTDNGVGRENMYKTLLGAQRRGFLEKDIQIYHYSITQNKYSGH